MHSLNANEIRFKTMKTDEEWGPATAHVRLSRHHGLCGHNVALPPNDFRFSRCETDKRICSPNIEAAFWKEKEACPINNNTSPSSLETCFIYRAPYLLLLLSSWYCAPTRMSANTTNFNSLRHNLLRQIFYNLYLLWMSAVLPYQKKANILSVLMCYRKSYCYFLLKGHGGNFKQ